MTSRSQLPNASRSPASGPGSPVPRREWDRRLFLRALRGDLHWTLWRERYHLPAALPFLLLEILEDLFQVIVERAACSSRTLRTSSTIGSLHIKSFSHQFFGGADCRRLACCRFSDDHLRREEVKGAAPLQPPFFSQLLVSRDNQIPICSFRRPAPPPSPPLGPLGSPPQPAHLPARRRFFWKGARFLPCPDYLANRTCSSRTMTLREVHGAQTHAVTPPARLGLQAAALPPLGGFGATPRYVG